MLFIDNVAKNCYIPLITIGDIFQKPGM